MKVLFVYRGYGKDGSNSVVDFQRESLLNEGMEVDKFLIQSGGIRGYYLAATELKKYLSENEYDLIHAHYSFSGFISSVASKKPVVCSLMGSDLLQQDFLLALITRVFYKFFWRKTVVKSSEMLKKLPKAIRIPNGVDFINFREILKEESQLKVGFNPGKKNIVFVAQNPYSKVKNIQLAEESIKLLNDNEFEFHIISNKRFSELPYYYNAADLLLLTSLSEGSPNVIKEAMACNTPIVATDVGDIKEIMGDTEGTSISSFDPKDVARKIDDALKFGKRTKGRMKISHLNTVEIAAKMFSVYQNIVSGNE